MSNNFKAFEFGLRIAPGLSADPAIGKIGEIYWNIPRNVLRICTDSSPVVWQDLFIHQTDIQGSTLHWDVASDRFISNPDLLINESTIYTPESETGKDLIITAGNTTEIDTKGSNVKIVTGTGDDGRGIILVDSPEISALEDENGVNLLIKAGNSTIGGNIGGDLHLRAGEGEIVPGTVAESEITFRADVDGDLSSTYFNLFAPGQDYYVWFNSGPGLAQKQSIEITEIGTDFQTGMDGLYFTIDAPGNPLYFWYNTGTEDDPAVLGRNGYEVEIESTDDQETIAEKTKDALLGSGLFDAEIIGPDLATIISTNNSVGKVDAADKGTTDSIVVVIDEGYNAAVDPNIFGKIGIPIPFNIDDGAETVAISAETEIDAFADFDVSRGINILTIIRTSSGLIDSDTDSNVGGDFDINIISLGSNDVGGDGSVIIKGGHRIELNANVARLKPSSSDPAGSFSNGDIYYNSSVNRFKKFQNGEWRWIEYSKDHVPMTIITYKDNTLTVLPSETGTLVDGAIIVSGDLVLFTNLDVDNNFIYRASVSGASISWTLVPLGQTITGLPNRGDLVYVIGGTISEGLIFKYDGSLWLDIANHILGAGNQDRGIKIVGGGIKVYNDREITSTGKDARTLQWSEGFNVIGPNLPSNGNYIAPGEIVLGEKSAAYVIIDRTGTNFDPLVPQVESINNIPIDSANGSDIVIFAYKVGDRVVWGNSGDESSDISGVWLETEFLNNIGDTFYETEPENADGMIIAYSINRGSDREIGYLYTMCNGDDATVVGNSGSLGATGIYFNAELNKFTPDPKAITSIDQGGTETVTAVCNGHGFNLGETFEISGNSEAEFNGSWEITAIIDSNTFEFEKDIDTVSGTGGEADYPSFPTTMRLQYTADGSGEDAIFRYRLQKLLTK